MPILVIAGGGFSQAYHDVAVRGREADDCRRPRIGTAVVAAVCRGFTVGGELASGGKGIIASAGTLPLCR